MSSVVGDVISNGLTIHSGGDLPVLKVEGFDGYDFASLGVTEQFLSDAHVYYEKYTKPEHFKDLYSIALRLIDLPKGRVKMLDIGTGGGNSLFAMLSLVGADRLEALGVDISPQLLELCANAALTEFKADPSKLGLVCADLYDLDIIPESVDLVAGSSILHHMIDPAPIVRKALSALKPGGSAIFTEPFEDGHGLLCNAYRLILSFSAIVNEPLEQRLATFMEEIIRDFDARKGIDDIRDYTHVLDDKWFFTRSWFYDLGREFGCDVRIVPTHGAGPTIFWEAAKSNARLHNGADANSLPDWAKQIIQSLDETFSERQKADFAFTAVVVFTKQ